VSNPDEPNTSIDIDIENGGKPEQDPADPDVTTTPDEDATPTGGTSDAGETRTAERTGSDDGGGCGSRAEPDPGENR
jgi:hypothetical protein